MKLYTADMAPNPKRVTMFAAAKGLSLELVQVNIREGEQKTPEFLVKNPSGKIPVLELHDGTCIAETIAICRYLEALQPTPNLFGSTPLEIAQIEMQHRFIEFELFSQVGTSWVNGPIIAATGLIEPIEAAKARSDGLVNAYYERLDRELSVRPFIAGERFTVADITSYCIIEFASNLVGLKPHEKHSALWGWYQSVAEKGFD
ncbi:MAG: glutathione S-transferase family protein [Pseudomonadota bacterium]